MPDSVGRLLIGSQGDRPVGDIVGTLTAIRRAHDGLLVLSELLELIVYPYSRGRGYFMDPRQVLARYVGVEGPDEGVFRLLIAPDNELVLRSVSLASPGFFEVVGAMNPLTFIRDMLNDHHRRRQDREYREGSERRSLELDNMIKENEVIAQRLAMAQDFGLSPTDTVQFINALAIQPLLELDQQITSGGLSPIPDSVELLLDFPDSTGDEIALGPVQEPQAGNDDDASSDTDDA